MNTNSSAISFVNPSNSNFNAAVTEMSAAGTLATLAAQFASAGAGQVVVATFGATAVTVSLPAVVAVGAAVCVSLSLGKKIVNTIN